MEIYRNLTWSRATKRSPKSQIHYYDFNFSDHEDDVFYQNLNEMDSVFVEESKSSKLNTRHYKNLTENTDNNSNNSIPIDPRTNTIIENIEINHTLEHRHTKKLKLFNNFRIKSLLKQSEHETCIRAINKIVSMNIENEILNEDMDVIVYHSLEAKRLEEKEQFNIFVQNYFNTYLIDRFKNIDDIPKQFILKKEKYRIDGLIRSEISKNYLLQSSLPSVGCFTENKKNEIEFIKTNHQTGIIPYILLPVNPKSSYSLKNANDKLLFYDPNKIHQTPDLLNDNNISNILIENNEIDVISTCSGLYHLLDTSLESWNLEIVVKSITNKNIIFIKKPLPKSDSNSIDMIKKSFKYALKYSILCPENKATWSLDQDTNLSNIKLQEENKSNEKNIKWKLTTIDSYLKNIQFPPNYFQINHNLSYSTWNVSDSNLHLLLRTKQDGREKGDLINLSTKIEFKSEFGAEEMTKSELIKEWLRQYFHPHSITKRIRIDTNTSIVLSQTNYDINKIENDLMRLYKLDKTFLLNDLIYKLNIIKTFPEGEYLLRHNAKKFNNILILCSTTDPCDKIDKTKFNLKLYLETIDLFNLNSKIVNYSNLNKIDDTEVMLIHKQACIMPCAFPTSINQPKNYLPDDKIKFNSKYQRKCDIKKDERLAYLREIKRRKSANKKRKRSVKRLEKATMKNNEDKGEEDFYKMYDRFERDETFVPPPPVSHGKKISDNLRIWCNSMGEV